MLDWLVSNPIAYIGAILVILVGGTLLKRAVNRGVNRAVQNTQHGITADQTGNPHIEQMILSQSLELHFDAPLERVAPLLSEVRMPLLFNRIGELGWGDRRTMEEALSYGHLEPMGNRCRARMLWGQDSQGMPGIESDWKALRKRLTKAAEAAGITVIQHQGPRMNRVPISDLPSHLRPEQSALADHRWQSAEG